MSSANHKRTTTSKFLRMWKSASDLNRIPTSTFSKIWKWASDLNWTPTSEFEKFESLRPIQIGSPLPQGGGLSSGIFPRVRETVEVGVQINFYQRPSTMHMETLQPWFVQRKNMVNDCVLQGTKHGHWLWFALYKPWKETIVYDVQITVCGGHPPTTVHINPLPVIFTM